jgi:hypothetical protein
MLPHPFLAAFFMRLLRALLPLVAVFIAACSDSPTEPVRTGQVSTSALLSATAGATAQDDASTASCCTLEPVIVVADPKPGCDPYLQIDNSCDGGGECMSSINPTSPDYVTISGCPGGDTGGGSDAGDGPDGGTAGGGGTTFPKATGTAAEGPLAWGACVLAVLGSVYTIDQVAGEFKGWWEAERRYRIAFDSWSYMLNHPETQLYDGQVHDLELRVDIAEKARNDAVESVRQMTGGSVLALLGAGAACGIAAIAPTP